MQADEVSSSNFSFQGKTGEFILVLLKNIFFTLLTLGIYFPYAKTNIRKFFWQNLKYDNHFFSYEGTGKELLKGYAIAVLFLVVTNGGIYFINMINPTFATIATAILYATFVFYIFPLVVFGSRRYLLGRTIFRGIRFNLSRSKRSGFIVLNFKEVLMLILTFGIRAPWFIVNRKKYLIENSTYGNMPFSFRGKGSDLLLIYIKGILLSTITIGIYSFWMSAEVHRFHMNNTYLDGKPFGLNLTGVDMLLLTLLNMLVLTLTLGLGLPWIMVHNTTFIANKTVFHGKLDYDLIEQGKIDELEDGTGDSFSDVLDLDVGL